MTFEKDGVQYWSSVKAPFRSTQHYWKDLAWNVGIKGLFFGDSLRLDKDNQLFLYRTVGNGSPWSIRSTPLHRLPLPLQGTGWPWLCTTCGGNLC